MTNIQKNIGLLLLTGHALVACSSGSTSNASASVYLDNSYAENDVISLQTTYYSFHQNNDSSWSSSITVSIKNLSNSPISLRIGETSVLRESTNYKYSVTNNIIGEVTIDSELSRTVSFSSKIPTSVSEENYNFSTQINGFQYTVKLRETPDSERKDLTVTYSIGGSIVKTSTVKERRPLKESYVYENPNHLTHCSSWADSNGKTVSQSTIVNEDMTLNGKEVENLDYFELHDSLDSSIQKVLYTPSDGVVVIPEKHGQYTVKTLANYGIFQLPTLKTLYLPSTMTKFYYGNFQQCPKLKTIHFAGTEAQWNSIISSSSSAVPTGVTVKFNASFK